MKRKKTFSIPVGFFFLLVLSASQVVDSNNRIRVFSNYSKLVKNFKMNKIVLYSKIKFSKSNNTYFLTSTF